MKRKLNTLIIILFFCIIISIAILLDRKEDISNVNSVKEETGKQQLEGAKSLEQLKEDLN